jgi:hypothetical protein
MFRREKIARKAVDEPWEWEVRYCSLYQTKVKVGTLFLQANGGKNWDVSRISI